MGKIKPQISTQLLWGLVMKNIFTAYKLTFCIVILTILKQLCKMIIWFSRDLQIGLSSYGTTVFRGRLVWALWDRLCLTVCCALTPGVSHPKCESWQRCINSCQTTEQCNHKTSLRFNRDLSSGQIYSACGWKNNDELTFPSFKQTVSNADQDFKSFFCTHKIVTWAPWKLLMGALKFVDTGDDKVCNDSVGEIRYSLFLEKPHVTAATTENTTYNSTTVVK